MEDLGYATAKGSRVDVDDPRPTQWFDQALDLSNEAVTLWRQTRELCQARPSPLNAPDLFLAMAPIVVLRGTKDAVSYYRKLKAEVEERVARGQGALFVRIFVKSIK